MFVYAQIRFDFNGRGLLTGLARHDILGDLSRRETYARDAGGRLISIESPRRPGDADNDLVRSTYSERDQLLQVDHVYDTSGGRVVARVEIEYEAQQASETLWREDVVRSRRLHELNDDDRVSASFELHEDGSKGLLVRYTYTVLGGGSVLCEACGPSAALLSTCVWDAAGDELCSETYDRDERLSWRTEFQKCGREWTKLSWHFVYEDGSKLATSVTAVQSTMTLPDYRLVRSRFRKHGGVLTPGEVNGERRYEYVDDACGNWVRRETHVQPEGGEWELQLIHLRDIEYR